jgi:hypothetical protein
MKKIFTIIFFLVLVTEHNGYSQPKGLPFSDAVTMITNLQSSNPSLETITGIIAYYFDSNKIKTIEDAVKAIKANPKNVFLNDPIILQKIEALNGRNINPGAPQGVGTAIFGADVTNYADGIAKFLISRGKQELSMAFFDRFKTDLKKYPELVHLFPKTTDIINNIENYNILTLLQQLRDAFIKDLSNEPNNLLTLRDLDASSISSECNSNNTCISRIGVIQTALNKEPLSVSLNLMQGIIDGNNILVILDKIANDKIISINNDEFTSYIKFTSLFLQSLKADKGGLLINEADLRNLFSSRDLLNIFFGLVYQKYSSIDCYKNLKIGNVDLQTILSDIFEKRDKFYATLGSFDNINTAYIAIRQKASDGDKADNSIYASFIASSISSISNVIKTYATVVAGTSLTGDYQRLFGNLGTGSDLCIDIQQRNYAGIFNDCIKLINDNTIFTDNTSKEKVIKYLSFASNLASATNSNEVQNALETVSLPPGSYSIKQNSAFNISLNGYIGYAWDFNKGLFAHGVYAPIGVSFNWGLGTQKTFGSLSLFASLIDVGSVASYRLGHSDSTDTLKQQVRLESIISPSVQLIYDIPKTPIAICAGWRMTPKLFYSGQQTFKTVVPENVFNLSVLIDIPIFTLKNTPRK